MWPAWYRENPDDSGTVYIEPRDFPKILDAHGRAGQGWRFHGEWTTYCPSRERMYKTLNRLKPSGEEDFWHIMGSCRDAGLNPPTSFVDCFMGMADIPLMPRKSPARVLEGESYGGWQQMFRSRPHDGTVYKYDMNKAYRWAACQGLPDLLTAKYIYQYEPGRLAVYDACLPAGSLPYWGKNTVRGFVTSEELMKFHIVPDSIRKGVAFEKTVNLTPTFLSIDEKFPWCRDRISRAFWGLWNAKEGPEQCSWKCGEKARSMANPFYNPVWALYITSRVKGRIADVLPVALHCQVDAVLTTEPLLEGPNPGDWRFQGEFPSYRGLWIGPQEEKRLTGNAGNISG